MADNWFRHILAAVFYYYYLIFFIFSVQIDLDIYEMADCVKMIKSPSRLKACTVASVKSLAAPPTVNVQ